MNVVIHADASTAMGTGHVVRCLALAAALRAEGVRVTLAAGEILSSLREEATRLGVEVVPRTAASRRPDWAIFDGYHLDAAARLELTAHDTTRLVIDDLGGEVTDAVFALNQNLYASPGGPTHAPQGELLAGPRYALLRPEYADVAPRQQPQGRANRILLTMGGADPEDATSRAARSLATLRPRPLVRVVIGAGHPAPQTVTEATAGSGFEVVTQERTLAPHLAWADMVVSGCGTTVLEATRMGRPIVGVVLADNQRRVAEALESEGLGLVVGRHPTLDEERLRSAVAELRDDHTTRARMASRGPVLVDGRGGRRVARALQTGPLSLRPATMADSERLLAWRNDPGTRAGSFDSAPVDEQTHRAWLSERIGSADHRVWIGELAGAPTGVVRFSIDGGRATISVTVSPDRREGGIGLRLITTACSRLAADATASTVDAWVKPQNSASQNVFHGAGFRPAVTDAPNRLLYRLSLQRMP